MTKNQTINYRVDMDVHHLRYYRNGKSILWHEQLSDLEVLCRSCHTQEHKTPR
jgi:5-methylcytosine-specific restriction endonuclease McrA